MGLTRQTVRAQHLGSIAQQQWQTEIPGAWLAWHPSGGEGGGGGEGTLALATAAADSQAALWSGSGKQLRILAGHTARLGRLAFHPFGAPPGHGLLRPHLAAVGTWRPAPACWSRRGHSLPVYSVAFQCDGALAVSVGLDAYGRVWDLRTGRSIMTLEGHVKGILAADWSPNGHVIGTGSIDHSVRIWDIRGRRSPCLFTIPAHKSLVSQVRFESGEGHYLLTTGYDKEAKLWSARDFRPLRVLSGHEGKVMNGDVCPDGSGLVATVGYDRTLKLWAPLENEFDSMDM
eukprot:jgi/Botrbrau1/7562/Bobra.0159s0012.1